MADQPYTPSEEHFRDYYVGGRSEYDPDDPGDDASREDWDRFIAKVKRDAAREALDGLRSQELAMIPADADGDHPIRIQKQALAWRIEMLILSDYPKETP